MATIVTIISGIIAFPIAYYMARYASGRTKALFYVAVMLPLWSNYLVRVYSWRLILAKEGVIHWAFNELGLGWVLDGILSLPVVQGSSLSTSHIGTCITFVYIWLPYMILPLQAALERVPRSLHRGLQRSRRQAQPDLPQGDLPARHSRASRRARSSPSR